MYFGKFAKGWANLCNEHPDAEVTVHLVSNKSRDSSLGGIIAADGTFDSQFIQGRVHKERRQLRQTFEDICAKEGLDDQGRFKQFLQAFRFDLVKGALPELKDHIAANLLDHRLGISDRKVFHELKRLMEKHAIELHEPVTFAAIDEILTNAQRRYRLPQTFPVDVEHFVALPSFAVDLDSAISDANGEYVVVTGLPGSGKSTSLSTYVDGMEASDAYAVCRYYCFVDVHDDLGRMRSEAQALRTNLLSELQRQFPDILDRRFDFGEENFAQALRALGDHMMGDGRKLVVLLDGLDHPLLGESP